MNEVNFMLNRKKGSALLIVIGFLSFMIVSAVAFSIYMRSERMPSSALRRTVATRQLAKAALAEAIAKIDDSIRGDAFPGLLIDNSRAQQYRENQWNSDRNYASWEGRVFMPSNKEKTGQDRHFAPATETVSVMTLEGMGYVPPPLVNDARILGRSTWTAAWQNFPYDAGRFAFVALNVSDFFDINRMYANKPRTSNADGRISLAYLLDTNPDYRLNPSVNEGGRPGELPRLGPSFDNFGSAPEKFDQKIHTQRDGGNYEQIGKDAPFVSALDYQLAIGKNDIPSMRSLFRQWIDNNNGGKAYYLLESEEYNSAMRQPFVTDSICGTNTQYQVDISTVEGQPFDRGTMKKTTASFADALKGAASSKFFTRLLEMKGRTKFADGADVMLAMAPTMYDYLDFADEGMPISLAWPCVERVPSLVNICPVLNFKLPSVVKGGTTWNFNVAEWFSPSPIRMVWAYPFRKNEDIYKEDYKVQTIVRFFLVEEEGTALKLRDDNSAQKLGQVLRPTLAEWNSRKGAMFSLLGGKVFCLSAFGESTLKLPNKVDTESDAVLDLDNPIMIDIESFGGNNTVPLMEEITTKDPQTQQNLTKYKLLVSPFNLKGEAMFQEIIGSELQASELTARLSGRMVRPYVAVWSRITKSNGKDTVDLVPAISDDDELNGNASGGGLTSVMGQVWPTKSNTGMLLFKGGQAVSYDKLFNFGSGAGGGGGGGGAVSFDPQSYSAVDPRFNWAPEDWYTSGDVNRTTWLSRTKSYLQQFGEANDCDHDIFLQVADTGFLQSLGEFSFLPRLTDPYNNGRLLLAQLGGGYNGVQRTNPQDIANARCAWTSYHMDWEMYEAFEEVGIGYSTASESLVNPYSPYRGIFMAALANTPCDYWSTATALSEDNVVKKDFGDTQTKVNSASEMVKEYSFCPNAEDSRNRVWNGKQLAAICNSLTNVLQNAQNLRTATQKVASRQTSDAWRWLWDQDEDSGMGLQWFPQYTASVDPGQYKQFMGIELDQPLYDVDRKFLRSYWRECFGNQQQLFLIFVRAESSAIGGPGEGTPAQKGARAVALVWRNPLATVDMNGTNGMTDDNSGIWNDTDGRRPHQTRILFYHQFD